MELNKETEIKIQEIQILEQNLHNLLMQKQAFQFELNETLNAIQEVSNTNDEIYKTVGSVIIKSDKKKVIKDLEDKKKVAELRISSVEKQEDIIESKLGELRQETKKLMQKKEK